MFKYNGSEVAHVFFDGLDIDIVNINGVKVFEAVRKTEYDPVLMTRTVTPYGETVTMDITDVQEGGHIDTANIVASGSIPVSNISVNGNKLSFNTVSCSKGITGKIQVPVVECKDYFDYLIPIELDSCTHPSSKLTYHSGSSATCTGSGYSAYYTCSCDSASHTLDTSGNEISTYIAPLGHSFTQDRVWSEDRQLRSDATCTEAATYWRECDRCTTHSTTQYFSSGSALGHDFTSQSTTSTYLKSAATCTSAATYYYKCSRCNEKGTSYYSYGSALGHSFTQDKIWSADRQLRSAATCGSYATYWRECDRCTTHSTTQWFYDTTSVKPPHSYTNSGYTSYYCSSCGASGGSSIMNFSSAVENKRTTVTGSSSQYTVTSTGSWTLWRSDFSTVPGKVYKFAFSLSEVSSPGCQVFIRDADGTNFYNTSQIKTGSSTKTGQFTAKSNTSKFLLELNNTSTVQDASCKFKVIIYPASS